MSIYLVAKVAKVSPSTVSKYINNTARISLEKQERIRNAMRKLDYSPPNVRRGPRLKNYQNTLHRHLAILFLGELKPIDLYKKPIFPSLFASILEETERNLFNLTVIHWPDKTPCPAIIKKNLVDGILIFGKTYEPEKLFSNIKVPAVWFFREHSDFSRHYDHVFYNNSCIGKIAFEYLYEKGCRSMCFINSLPENSAVMNRKIDFIRECHEKGVDVDVFEAEDKVEHYILRRTEELLDRACLTKKKYNGIFAPTDDILLYTYNHLKKHNIIPEKDIVLIGCNNDSVFMDQMKPRPATIDIKLDKIGQKAVIQILERIRLKNYTDPVEILIKPELIRGDIE
ncbi:MAG TPA: LacI family DNA-binding transcriptional regulator [Victivallales bacterium]|nr:LacI family DNA-binding transcriptional regulator [Victivallales bacterium]